MLPDCKLSFPPGSRVATYFLGFKVYPQRESSHQNNQTPWYPTSGFSLQGGQNQFQVNLQALVLNVCFHGHQGLGGVQSSACCSRAFGLVCPGTSHQVIAFPTLIFGPSPQQAVSLVWTEMECGWAELVPALRPGVGRTSKEQTQVNESQGRLY